MNTRNRRLMKHAAAYMTGVFLLAAACNTTALAGGIVQVDSTETVQIHAQAAEISPVLTSVTGVQLPVLEEKDGWVRIQIGEVDGWVDDDYLADGNKNTDVAPAVTDAAEAGEQTETVNVVQEPNEEVQSQTLAIVQAAATQLQEASQAQTEAQVQVRAAAKAKDMAAVQTEAVQTISVQSAAVQTTSVQSTAVQTSNKQTAAVQAQTASAQVQAAVQAQAAAQAQAQVQVQAVAQAQAAAQVQVQAAAQAAAAAQAQAAVQAQLQTAAHAQAQADMQAQAAAAAQAAVETAVLAQYGMTQDDLTLMAALIQCEAGGESYVGQVAVGNVVMNRVKDSLHPTTVRDVIYAPGQFCPVRSGMLSRTIASGKVSASCRQAALEALAGSAPVGDKLFFRRVNGRSGQIIGNHVFY